MFVQKGSNTKIQRPRRSQRALFQYSIERHSSFYSNNGPRRYLKRHLMIRIKKIFVIFVSLCLCVEFTLHKNILDLFFPAIH